MFTFQQSLMSPMVPMSERTENLNNIHQTMGPATPMTPMTPGSTDPGIVPILQYVFKLIVFYNIIIFAHISAETLFPLLI